MQREHYVYVHRRLSDGRLFYVGKGKKQRAWSACGRSRHWRFVVAKHGFAVSVLKDGLCEQAALALEQFVIAQIGLANLANATLGGGGIQGWRHSEETKRRIGAASKVRTLTEKQRAALRLNDGKKLSPEHRQKLSAAKRGKPGHKMSAPTRAKISAAHMGLRPSEETLRKMRQSHLGKHVGRDNATYDHTIRRFTHAELGEFVGTRGDLIARHGLRSSDMCSMLKGKRKSVMGWRVL